ncbi:MAG: alanine racemase, partial [Bacteroidota bacterium]
KIDTGMGRLGCDWRNAVSFTEHVARGRRLDLTGVYSHFATSDEPDQTFANEQLKRFCGVLDELWKRKIDVPLKHMANSGAILALPQSHFNMVRPGLMLYGYAPRRGMDDASPLRPVMSLVSKITLLKKVGKGTSISYGRRYHAPHDTRIATVPIGYADGYSRLLTNRASVLVRDKRHPVVGTVCMDHIMVDVGNEDEVGVGDDVVLLGSAGRETISAWDIAETLGTIPYEVLCWVSARVERVVG